MENVVLKALNFSHCAPQPRVNFRGHGKPIHQTVPYGTVSILRLVPGNKLPGYDHVVPTGQAITAFIAKDNPRAAEQFGFRLIDRVELLGFFPKLGRPVPEKENVRVLAEGPVRIYY